MTSSSDEKLAILVDHIQASRNGGGVGPLHTINYKTFPDWDKKALEITGGKGVDFVLEVSGLFVSLQRPVSSFPRLSAFAGRRSGHAREVVCGSQAGRYYHRVRVKSLYPHMSSLLIILVHSIGFLAGGADVQLPNVAMSTLFKSAIFRGVLIGSKKNVRFSVRRTEGVSSPILPSQFEALNSAIISSGLKPIVSKVYAFEDAPQAYLDQSKSGVVGKVVIRVAKQ